MFWKIVHRYVTVFAFCNLLGFSLMPRLKAIARQKLYLPDAGEQKPLPEPCADPDAADQLGADRLATTEIYLNLTESHVIEEYQNKW